MKKIILAAAILFGLSGIASAQVKPKKAEKIKVATTTTTTTPGPKKADGTLDMRYKQNKVKAKPVKLKADGTPDKRYKVNKQ
jgi:hypothetical protein